MVDDNEINLRVLYGLLWDRVALLRQADSGSSALTRFRAEAFDLVLLDLHMPQWDGRDLMREMCARLPADRPPPAFVVITADARRVLSEQLYAAGFAAVLHKPVEARQLYDCLQQVAGGGIFRAKEGQHRGDQVLDEAAALAASGNDVELMAALRERFLSDLAQEIPAIEQALMAGALEEAVSRLHRLAGGAAHVGARGVHLQALALEQQLSGGDLVAAADGYQTFLEQSRRLQLRLAPPPSGNASP